VPVTQSTLAQDAAKFIQDALIQRAVLLHKLPQFCEPVQLPVGMGLTANMMLYNRTDTMMAPLTEGVTPTETPFTLTSQTVTVNQWGLFIALTDVAVVTTKHPVLNEALDLVADAIARAQDYNIAEVLNAGTNVQYWDGSRATRGAILATDVFNKARKDLNRQGAPPREGDLFVAVFGPAIESDVIAEAAAAGAYTSVASQFAGSGDTRRMVMGQVLDWLGFRCVRSNFLPEWQQIALITPTTSAGGSLTGTVQYKVTRKATQRGFEEVIDLGNSIAMGGNGTLNFLAPATAGFVYNIYLGTVAGDANLFQAFTNLAAGATAVITTMPVSGLNPPATPPSGVMVHPIYCFAFKAVDYVSIDGLAIAGSITPRGPTDSDPLQQRRKVGAKYAQKAGIRDQNRAKRIEMASNF